MKKRIMALLLSLVMALSLVPTTVWAAGASTEVADDGISVQAANSTVVLHPSVNHTVTGVKVKVGDTISGYKVSSISGYDITVDLGKYNVNNGTFRLPYAKNIWEGVDNNKVDYISWAGSGSNRRSEGGNALLANGKNTAYYYFKGAPVLLTFTLNYDANGGTGAPASQTYKATSEYEKSHTFTISSQVPTREDYTFLGWDTNKNAATASKQPGNTIVVNNNNNPTTLYAVWKEKTPPAPTEPAAPRDDELKEAIGKIQVKDTPKAGITNHGMENFDLIDKSYTMTDVVDSKVTVTIAADKYVDAYNALHPNHTNAGALFVTLTLEKSGDKWSVADGKTPVTFDVECNEKEGPGETEPNFSDAKVIVKCVANNDNHKTLTEKQYSITEGDYTANYNHENGHTCTVTLNRASFIGKFGTDTGFTHKDKDPDTQITFTWTWSSEKGWVLNSEVAGLIKCECETTVEKFPVKLVIYRNGNTSEAYKTVDLGMHAKGETIDLTTLNIGDYYTANNTGKYDFYGWYDDGLWNVYKANVDKNEAAPAGMKTATVKGWTNLKCMVYDYEPVHVVIYRNGNTDKAYSDTALAPVRKGNVIDLTKLNIGDYYTANYTGKFDWNGWYNDGAWNVYKKDTANPPAGLTSITVNGWTNIIAVVYDYETVAYFGSAKALEDYQKPEHIGGPMYTTSACMGAALPTADAPTATRTGYTFQYWSREGQYQDVTGQTVGGWTNLYATWQANTYKVTFDVNANGDKTATVNPADKEVTFDAPYGELAKASRAGYTFQGWFTAKEGGTEVKSDDIVKTAGNHTLYAHWEITPHNVYAYLRTGDSIGDVIRLEKSTLDRLGLNAYNKNGFIPVGKFVSNTVLAEDEYYGADEDEAFLNVIKELKAKIKLGAVGEKINWSWLYTPADVDDRIDGYLANDKEGYQLSGTLTLYSVMFKTEDSQNVKGMPKATYGTFYDYYIEGETITMPANPTRTGYDFKGWAVNGKTVDTTNGYTITGDVVFTAQWEKQTYTVKFDSMGGSKIDDQKVKYQETAIKPTDPTKSGYTFGGWYTDNKCTKGNEFRFDTKITGDITLYAKWDVKRTGTNPDAKNPYIKDNTTKTDGKKVESGKTFDAGIAMYVGLSILSVTGSAVVIRKRKDF